MDAIIERKIQTLNWYVAKVNQVSFKILESILFLNYLQSGKYYERKSDYECCNNNYLPVAKNSSNNICCGGVYVSKINNYQCCGGLYYLFVDSNQICCSNNHELTDEIASN